MQMLEEELFKMGDREKQLVRGLSQVLYTICCNAALPVFMQGLIISPLADRSGPGISSSQVCCGACSMYRSRSLACS